MLNLEQAVSEIKMSIDLVYKYKVIDHLGNFLFLVAPKGSDSFMDPFFIVDRVSGDVLEFSIFTDGDMASIISVFEKEDYHVL